MRDRLGWLGHILWINDDGLPKIVIFGRSSRAKEKSRREGGRNLFPIKIKITSMFKPNSNALTVNSGA